MKIIDIIKKVPNTITGALVVAVGVVICKIPVAGPIAGPIIITAGLGQMGLGVKSKMDRTKEGLDPLSKEKALLGSIIKKKEKKDGTDSMGSSESRG